MIHPFYSVSCMRHCLIPPCRVRLTGVNIQSNRSQSHRPEDGSRGFIEVHSHPSREDAHLAPGHPFYRRLQRPLDGRCGDPRGVWGRLRNRQLHFSSSGSSSPSLCRFASLRPPDRSTTQQAPKAFGKKRTLRPEVEASPKSGIGEVEIPLARMGGVGYFRNSALSARARLVPWLAPGLACGCAPRACGRCCGCES
jgi:hypothetical protein